MDGLREAVAAGGDVLNGVSAYVSQMANFSGQEGVQLIDSMDEYQTNDVGSFAGVGEILDRLGQQLAGILQIPLTRLLGQSPAGLSATGDSDLQTYFNSVAQIQNSQLKSGLIKIYHAIAASEKIKLADDFKIDFNPLFEIEEKEKAGITTAITGAVGQMYEQGIIGRATALKELKTSATATGVFNSITDEDIAGADDEPLLPELNAEGPAEGDDEENEDGGKEDKKADKGKK
jgi:uncharacterized protein